MQSFLEGSWLAVSEALNLLRKACNKLPQCYTPTSDLRREDHNFPNNLRIYGGYKGIMRVPTRDSKGMILTLIDNLMGILGLCMLGFFWQSIPASFHQASLEGERIETTVIGV